MQKKSYGVTTVTNIVWNFLEKLLRKGVGIGVTLILAWLLVPEDFGLIALIAIFIEISYVFVNGGFVDAIIRKKDVSQLDLDTVFYTNLALSAVMYGILYVSAPLIASFYDQPSLIELIRVASLALFFQAFCVVPNALMRKRLLFKKQLQVALPSSILSGIVAIILAYFDYGVWALVTQMMLAPLITAILYWRLRLWMPKWQFSTDSLKSFFHFSGFLLIHQLVNSVFINLITMVVGKFFPVSVLGYYYFADRIRRLVVQQIVSAVQEVSYPVLANIQDDRQRMAQGYSKVMTMTGFILLPALLILSALVPIVFDTILPQKWQGSVEMLQLMLIASVFYPFNMLAENVFKSVGRADRVFYLGLINKSLMLVFLSITVSHGILAIIMGQLAASVVMFVIYSLYIRKNIHYGFRAIIRDLAPSALTSVAIAALILAADDYFYWHSAIELILYSVSAGILYLAISIIFRFKAMTLLIDLVKNRGKPT